MRADLFAAAPLRELVSLASDAGTSTWLIFDKASRRRAADELLRARPAHQLKLNGTAQAGRNRTGSRARPWPMPSPWVARAAAARIFTVQQFNDVDARMHSAFKSTSTYVASQRQLHLESVERFLDVITTDPVARHRHARLLGARCALLQHGFASEINERLVAKRTIVASPTSAQAIEFRRYSSPPTAALHVLSLLTELDRTTLEAITLDQIVQTSQGVYVGGIPPPRRCRGSSQGPVRLSAKPWMRSQPASVHSDAARPPRRPAGESDPDALAAARSQARCATRLAGHLVPAAPGLTP